MLITIEGLVDQMALETIPDSIMASSTPTTNDYSNDKDVEQESNQSKESITEANQFQEMTKWMKRMDDKMKDIDNFMQIHSNSNPGNNLKRTKNWIPKQRNQRNNKQHQNRTNNNSNFRRRHQENRGRGYQSRDNHWRDNSRQGNQTTWTQNQVTNQMPIPVQVPYYQVAYQSLPNQNMYPNPTNMVPMMRAMY